MSWINVVWPMLAAVYLTLAAIHAVLGVKLKSPAHLWFSMSAVAAACVSACELVSMRAVTADEWAAALRWGHLAFFVLIFSLVWFVRSFFGAGRLWLGWTAIAARATSLVVNFARPPNLNFTSVTGVQSIPFWFGEHVSVPVGARSHWTRLGEIASILLLAFLIDATRSVWLRGDHPRAMMCGTAVLFLVAATVHAAAIHAGLIRSPYLVSVAYFVILTTMSYDLTREFVRASDLARQLSNSEAGLIVSRDAERRAVGEARQAEEWFREVFEAAPNALILADAERHIRLVNAHTESVFGYSRDELINRSIETLVPERYHEGHRRDGDEFLRSPTSRQMGAGRELFGRRKDGTEFPVEIGLNPVHARDGFFVLASVIDITERRRSELEFDRQRNELAHLSRLTTIGELAGSLAHELNQPLTAILSNAQAAQRLLSKQPVDIEEVSAILHDIVDSDRHAGEVIQRLRAMLRKGEERSERLDMSEIVQDVLKLARSDLLNHGVAVSTKLAQGPPAVAGDRVQLFQVFLNLLLNGCDAMETQPRDRRRLEIGTEVSSADDDGVHAWVRDSGAGIPEDRIHRIFEPFFTTKGSGMGLGLSVCRTIVAAHGGKIWATNNPDRGATLHLRLPTLPVSEQETSEKASG